MHLFFFLFLYLMNDLIFGVPFLFKLHIIHVILFLDLKLFVLVWPMTLFMLGEGFFADLGGDAVGTFSV